jgi:ABC-2 type transport system ATP-binding protein
MRAGGCVGRIGGLAVALGIGAAVFTGHGVASAEPSDTPGSDSSSTNSSTSTSTGSSGTTSTSSTSTGSSTQSSGTTSSPASASPDETESTSTAASEAKETSETKTPDAPTDSTETTSRKTNKRSSDSPSASNLVKPPDVSIETTRPTTDQTPSVHSEKAASTTTVDEEPAADAALTASVVTSVTTTADDPVVTAAAVQQPEASTVTAPDRGDVVTVAMSSLVSATFSPLSDSAPTAPADSPAMWTLLAAARRESFGTAPALDKLVSPVTNGLVAAEVDAAEPATALAQPVGTVIAIDQPPLLGWMQEIPVIGPMLVTPIVAVIHQIPYIGDILHPIIGYPLGLTGGTTPRDVKVISFDGTPIYVHFFPAPGLLPGKTAPTVLNGQGLSLPGETDATAEGMAPLLRSGYNVITWDPRGVWSSGGQLQIDSPDFEGRDVSTIISWLAQQPEARLDSPGDPRIGMVGSSYGGGIQLVTAAIDPRVDAIVPTIAWHSLNTSLYKSEAFKTSWGTLLTAALVGTFARVNPQIYAAIWGALTGTVTQADQDLLDQRGPDELVNNITAPTLLIQGTVDTLFTLQEADANAKVLIANGVPTKVVWYCGGHGGCITSTNDGELIERRTLDWLDRYVNGDLSVTTGPQFEWVDQHGQQFSSDTYPVKQGSPLVASTSAGGVLPLIPFLGGSGPQAKGVRGRPLPGVARAALRRAGSQRVEPHHSGRHHDDLHRRRAAAHPHLFRHGHQPPRLRPACRRHHRPGARQSRNPDSRDVGRADTHDHHSHGDGRAHSRPG